VLFAARRSKAALSFLIAFSLGVAPGPVARADDADLAQGRKLYAQGLTQEAAGDWAGALQSFEEVAKVKMTPQVRFHIARCKEKLGRWNEALGGYRLAEYEAEGSAEISPEIEKARTELEAKIPKLVIERGRGADAIKVELDGVALGDTQIGAEIAVDPGKHLVVGIVGSGRKFRRQVSVEAGKTERLVLDVPDELSEEPTTHGPGTDPKVEPTDSVGGEKKVASDSAAPFILGGIGIASLIGAGVFYKMRNDAEQELESGCIGKTCPDSLEDTQSRGQTYAALSGVMLGIGIVGIGAGTLLLVSRSSSTSETTSQYRPMVGVGPRGGSVSFAGRF
jgi:hypothetical protein